MLLSSLILRVRKTASRIGSGEKRGDNGAVLTDACLDFVSGVFLIVVVFESLMLLYRRLPKR
jgi:hypothetical protein